MAVRVYQAETEEVSGKSFVFGIVLNREDISIIMQHNPANIKLGKLRMNISFCEPTRDVEMDLKRRIYFVPLSLNAIRFLIQGVSLVTFHTVKNVMFIFMILFEEKTPDLQGKLSARLAEAPYVVLNGSEAGVSGL